MEDTQAAFVNMLMERLQALEGQVQQLGAENAILQTCTHQLRKAVHLKPGLVNFSDEWRLHPRFTTEADKMWDDTVYTERISPMDDLHLDATAGYGRMQIRPVADLAQDNLICLGEREEDRVTVRELLQGINAWCSKPYGDTTNFLAHIDDGGDGPPLLDSINQTGFDRDTKRMNFEMSFSY